MKLEEKCENKVTSERTHTVISGYCPDCNGFDIYCSNYRPVKRSQLPVRRGLFAQKEYFRIYGDI